jgi:hypothetical protein
VDQGDVGIPVPASPLLARRFGLVHATALNMINMIGIGPFITIPLLIQRWADPRRSSAGSSIW